MFCLLTKAIFNIMAKSNPQPTYRDDFGDCDTKKAMLQWQ